MVESTADKMNAPGLELISQKEMLSILGISGTRAAALNRAGLLKPDSHVGQAYLFRRSRVDEIRRSIAEFRKTSARALDATDFPIKFC